MSDKPHTQIRVRAISVLRRRKALLVLLLLLSLYLSVAVWNVYKPLPQGLNAEFGPKPAQSVDFLVDATWINPDGTQAQSTQIFEQMIELIDQARQLVVLEMFLLNDFAGPSDHDHRPLSTLILDALVRRKQARPDMEVVLITDPFNRLYGGVESSALDTVSQAGVQVIETKLSALRDSNPVWSGFWRLCCQFIGNSTNGWLSNPVGGPDVSLRTYLSLLNFKANHRKALVVDSGSSLIGLVTSGNAHDASSRHSNVGLSFSGPAAMDLLETMEATARFSGQDPTWSVAYEQAPTPAPAPAPAPGSMGRVSIITEAAISKTILDLINGSSAGDRLDLALFYLSHREIVTALEQAQERDVSVRLLMDPNEDAFGRKKDGVPNRQVAFELSQNGVPIRWCNTRGEQCHYKHLLHIDELGHASLLVGSANFTRRNLDGFNLETQVLFEGGREHPVLVEAAAFFDERWNNLNGRLHSLDYADFEDTSRLRYWRYRFMEASGLSTF